MNEISRLTITPNTNNLDGIDSISRLSTGNSSQLEALHEKAEHFPLTGKRIRNHTDTLFSPKNVFDSWVDIGSSEEVSAPGRFYESGDSVLEKLKLLYQSTNNMQERKQLLHTIDVMADISENMQFAKQLMTVLQRA